MLRLVGETHGIGSAFRDAPRSSSVLPYLNPDYPTRLLGTTALNIGYLACQPERAPQRLEHRKSMVLAQNLVPLKYRWRFHGRYLSLGCAPSSCYVVTEIHPIRPRIRLAKFFDLRLALRR